MRAVEIVNADSRRFCPDAMMESGVYNINTSPFIEWLKV